MDEKMDNQLIERVLLAHVEEQRKARRWAIVWRMMGFVVILIAVSVSFFSGGTATNSPPSTPHTAMVDLSGVIDSEGEASAAVINEALRMAFESEAAKGVILRVNSPGGSPVQSGIVFDEIRRLRAAHADKPLIAVVEDVAASGGYYIAAAADSIYVDKASLIGSIGVRMDSFGFTEAMKKLGVERRVLTAGENKAMLDPFLPVDPKQKEAIQSMLGEVHQQFVNAVKQGRGERLKADPNLFTGMVWTGSKSIELGLTDGLGTIDSVARDVIKAEEIVDYSMQPNLLERLSRRFGASMGESMARALMHWSIQ
jgi:protease IV